jgi:hypothetical protein
VDGLTLGISLQSTEQRQPTSPNVFEYPTRKHSGLRHFGDAKKMRPLCLLVFAD